MKQSTKDCYYILHLWKDRKWNEVSICLEILSFYDKDTLPNFWKQIHKQRISLFVPPMHSTFLTVQFVIVLTSRGQFIVRITRYCLHKIETLSLLFDDTVEWIEDCPVFRRWGQVLILLQMSGNPLIVQLGEPPF